MENRSNESREWTENADWKQDPGRPDAASGDPPSGEGSWSPGSTASRSPGKRGSTARRGVASWISWQSALYLLVVGTICLVLVPLTSFWWIVPVCATAVPVALAVLDGPGRKLERPNDRKAGEQELLEALVERGEITPATAAMRTLLTVDEASKMLEDLARKGHLRPQVEEGVTVYTLRERDRHEPPYKASTPLEVESESNGEPQRLADPLSEREREVLDLLASGRTNSEVARDLFVSVGTVKSHTGNIYRKLDAKNRTEALARARELSLLP